ncbi:hypothetical protein L5515_012478 [Caenorhabditis briggsae]|uniref:Uncharacterized protein n=1 Tax=Caenorhabditis briggsae TaxID=6238 RepID=A0AAE9JJ46_CAEBR|nr:hypothetical protein L5515_012478 [Caenorhabditis briggsae]
MAESSDQPPESLIKFMREIQKQGDEQLKQLTDGAQKFMDMYAKTYTPQADLEQQLKESQESERRVRQKMLEMEIKHKEYVLKLQDKLTNAEEESENLKAKLEVKFEEYGERPCRINPFQLKLSKMKIDHQQLEIQNLNIENSRLFLTLNSMKEESRIEHEQSSKLLTLYSKQLDNTLILMNEMRTTTEDYKLLIRNRDEHISELKDNFKDLVDVSNGVKKTLKDMQSQLQKALTVIGRQDLELEDLRRLRDELEAVGTSESQKIWNLTNLFTENRNRMLKLSKENEELTRKIEKLQLDQKKLEKEHLEEVNELQMILETQDDELEKMKNELEKKKRDSGGSESEDSDGWAHLETTEELGTLE